MIERIGFMQGRLSPLINGCIQAFPWENWQNEFLIAQLCNFNLMEWTLDQIRLNENPLLTKEGQNQIRVLCKQYGVNIASVTGDCFMQSPLWKKKGKERLNLQSCFIEIIKACFELKIGLLIIPLVDNGRIENIEQENTLISFLEDQTNLLCMMNLKIAFESDYSPHELARFIGRLSPDFFGINYDIGNSAALGFNPQIEFDQYGSRVINVHIKDRILNGSTVPLGMGNANFDKIFTLLNQISYEGNFILQTARAEDNDHIKALCNYRNMTLNWLNHHAI